MDEQNEVMVYENEEINEIEAVDSENTEEGSYGVGKYVAAGVALGAAGVIVGNFIYKKLVKPLKRKLRDRLINENLDDEPDNVKVIDAETFSDDDVVVENGETEESNNG